MLKKKITLLKSDPKKYLRINLTKEVKTYVHTKTCTWMFTEALCLIAKTWKQPRCPSVGECVNTLWSVQTMNLPSVLQRNELSGHEKTWNNLKNVLLGEKSQSEMLCILYDSNYITFWNVAKLYRQ